MTTTNTKNDTQDKLDTSISCGAGDSKKQVGTWKYEEAQTEAFIRAGAFFSFSDRQYREKAQNGIKYISLGEGLVCPKNNAEKLMQNLDAIQVKKIKMDLEENGVKEIIWRELANYECQISMDYSDVVYALNSYGITEDQIKSEWGDYWDHCCENNYF